MAEIYDIKQAAAHFKVSTKTIRDMIHDGILPYFMIGGYKFTAEDFATAEQNLRKRAAASRQPTDKHKAVRPSKKQDREPVLV